MAVASARRIASHAIQDSANVFTETCNDDDIDEIGALIRAVKHSTKRFRDTQ